MPNKIESVGTFRGKITEHSLGMTKKQYPQAIIRLAATQKYVETPQEIAHFQTQGLLEDGQPGWVDWSSFGEEIVAFLVLYNNAIISPDTELLNVKQLNLATGWEAPDFDSLNNGSLIDKEILFKVEFRSYTNPETNKTTEGNQVTWIDNKDASPTPQLKALTADEVKGLQSRVSGYNKSAKPVKPTKPATSAVVPSVVPASAPDAATAAVKQPSVAKKEARKAPTAPTKPAVPPPPTTAAPAAGLPQEVTKDEAWDYVNANKGGNEDEVIADTWLSVIGEVAGNRQESDLTPADWAKVRDTVCKDLAI